MLFKYDFDKVRIKKAGYRPQAQASIENYQHSILIELNDVLRGRKPLRMNVENWPEQSEDQVALLQKLLSAVDEDGAYKVRIVSNPEDNAAG